MDKLTPEVIEQLLSSIPLFALGLALFIVSFLCLLVALFSLLPWAHTFKDNKPRDWKLILIVMLVGAVVFGAGGWWMIEQLNHNLSDTIALMSTIEVSEPAMEPEMLTDIPEE